VIVLVVGLLLVLRVVVQLLGLQKQPVLMPLVLHRHRWNHMYHTLHVLF
jgi:hypothetical protein